MTAYVVLSSHTKSLLSQMRFSFSVPSALRTCPQSEPRKAITGRIAIRNPIVPDQMSRKPRCSNSRWSLSHSSSPSSSSSSSSDTSKPASLIRALSRLRFVLISSSKTSKSSCSFSTSFLFPWASPSAVSRSAIRTWSPLTCWDSRKRVSVVRVTGYGAYLCRRVCGEIFQLCLERFHLGCLCTDHVAQRADQHGRFCARAFRPAKRGERDRQKDDVQTARSAHKWYVPEDGEDVNVFGSALNPRCTVSSRSSSQSSTANQSVSSRLADKP